MTYEHGVYANEKEEEKVEVVEVTSGLQVVIGTAPINLASNPLEVTNKPILITDIEEAKSKFGYSENFNDYTLCQSMKACFEIFKVAPVVFINVLDPTKHVKNIEETLTVTDAQTILDEDGVLLSELKLKNGDTTLTEEEYEATFNSDGKVLLTIFTEGVTTLTVTGKQIDPSLVTASDVIGGYDQETGKETGIELVRQVFPIVSLITGTILAPGWSSVPEVAAALELKCTKINGVFSAIALIDLSTTEAQKYTDIEEEKQRIGVSSKNAILLWPKVKMRYDSKVYNYSAVYGALLAYTDGVNGDIPSLSPSNKDLRAEAIVLDSGEEIILDQIQANEINKFGVVTALNFNGFRTWGVETSCFPENKNPKDRFINIRRTFNWWKNQFIVTYHDRVDDNTNFRLIQSLCDDENLRGNAYVAAGKLVACSIEYKEEENPVEQILEGKIVFRQKLAVSPPAKAIENILEFDPTALEQSLGGEEE